MEFIAISIGMGIGSTMLIYPIVYLIMKRKFINEYKWTKFLLGFGIASTLSGVTLTIFKMFISNEPIFGVLFPVIFSITVIGRVLKKKVV